MCGIAGVWGAGRGDPAFIERLIEPITHRGPDDAGVWTDAEVGIGLGHRRLSIVDLSPLGHQPMASNNGRFILSYNGEIYNHLDVRAELHEAGLGPNHNGVGWRSHSDTETLVEAIAAWGLERALKNCVGMFAFAVWDRQQQLLHLVRDRFGEKPLYYGWIGSDFTFGSELKTIRRQPGFDNPVSRKALHLYAARSYVPAPFSIYERIYKLEPGCILTVDSRGARTALSSPPSADVSIDGVMLKRFWSYRDVLREGFANPIESEAEALTRLETVLASAIKGQSVADVPVGAFLSGGIDSSTVVALYQKYSSMPVRTFSIGFEEAGFNEAQHAKAVAAHFGTVHSERYVTVKETRDVIPLLPTMYDEPFADSSQIPTHLVSRFAREEVTVALSGDGGDELFAGYNRHFKAPRMWEHLQRLPRPVRTLIAPRLGRLSSRFWGSAANLIPGQRQPHVGGKIQKALKVAGSARVFDDVYNSFLDEWSFEQSPVLGWEGGEAELDMEIGAGAPEALRMMYSDAMSYLPDDILCKVDRASMAVSLETRVPFLDHRVAEVAATIPTSMKIKNGSGKHILRELLYREAPRALFERPKAGFAIPIGDWLKGPLRPWAESLIDRKRLAEQGYLDPIIVHRRWQDHLSGRRDSTAALWAVLMFQAWMEEQSALPS